MPLLHCKKCHHEWEGEFHSKCDWFGAESYILEELTDLEELLHNKDKLIEIIELIRKMWKIGDDPLL
jgi:hypothetical protein